MLINDRQIIISTAGSRRATQWPASTLQWSELVDRLKTPVRGVELLAEYLALPKGKQDDLKDVGGFVGGTLKGNRRKAGNVIGRDIVTLDLDNIQPGQTQNILLRIDGLGCGYAVYSTRKHEEAKPRLRVILPLSRTANTDEYEPLSRKLAAIIGIELCDPSTFEASRLMYWPSCCKDSVYVYQFGDKPFLDTDGILSMYADWHNVAEWPEVPGAQQAHVKSVAKQGDPTIKTGIVGAFCKVYDIYKVMDTFLQGEYAPCDIGPDRFTFTGGSTVGGAVVYENGNFLYSHHATDPAGGKLCNAFDLVRYHKFASLDDDAKSDTPTNKLPSYTEMCKLAISNNSVAVLLNQEKYEKAVTDFSNVPEDTTSWRANLQYSSVTGLPAKTIDNILIILANDPLLKNKIAFDEFANRGVVLGDLPWDHRQIRRNWNDVDEAGIMYYMEKTYGITGDSKILKALALCSFRNSFDDVKAYLTGLSWDGIHRVDTLLINYLGAEDTPYIRAVMRKSLVASVARVMTPGCKYDYVPIFTGPTGIGKSTFLQKIGKDWYSESLEVFAGKEAAELIQGTWINELGELKGFNRFEHNAIKQFVSKRDDIYRKPFGHNTDKFPRRCVFFGTSNDKEFLRDPTGNRRFWPVDVGVNSAVKNVHIQLQDEVDQIWAEAFVYWQLGESLFFNREMEQEAFKQQEIHREDDSREGLILEFVERPLPLDWEKRSLGDRKLYWSGEFGRGICETTERQKVCAIEVWCECLGNDIKHLRQTDTRAINNILQRILKWNTCVEKFGPYGIQRGFKRYKTAK